MIICLLTNILSIVMSTKFSEIDQADEKEKVKFIDNCNRSVGQISIELYIFYLLGMDATSRKI